MLKRKSECQKVRDLLSPYIDGRLNSPERGLVEGHIEGCNSCRGELESLRATVNLLHMAPVVSPLRSFALAEMAPQRRPAAPRALRAATAVAASLLALVFLGDTFHLFGPGIIGEMRLAQDSQEMLSGGETAYGIVGSAWPVWQLEIALAAVVVILGSALAIVWLKRRKGGGRALKS